MKHHFTRTLQRSGFAWLAVLTLLSLTACGGYREYENLIIQEEIGRASCRERV